MIRSFEEDAHFRYFSIRLGSERFSKMGSRWRRSGWSATAAAAGEGEKFENPHRLDSTLVAASYGVLRAV
jgi:hypothetical protein